MKQEQVEEVKNTAKVWSGKRRPWAKLRGMPLLGWKKEEEGPETIDPEKEFITCRGI